MTDTEVTKLKIEHEKLKSQYAELSALHGVLGNDHLLMIISSLEDQLKTRYDATLDLRAQHEKFSSALTNITIAQQSAFVARIAFQGYMRDKDTADQSIEVVEADQQEVSSEGSDDNKESVQGQ